QDALEVAEKLRQAMCQKLLRATLGGSSLLLVVKGGAQWMVGVMNLDNEICQRELQLMGPQSARHVARREVQAAAQEQQNVGGLSDQLPAGLEERRCEGRALAGFALEQACHRRHSAPLI